MACTLGFNRSLRIEVRSERITGDAGAVTGRDVLRRSGVVRWMAKRISDARDGRRIRHPMTELLRTALLLAGQCRRDHNDAGAFGSDPAFRVGVSDRAGTAPLGWGLASQPTLSRLVAALAKGGNAAVLRGGLARFAGWRLRGMNNGRVPKRLVIDLDSLPVEVHGGQPGSEWNGYYHARIYHPLVASVGETGDILDVRLRKGAAHTAAGGLEFIAEVLDRAERFLCEKAMVRFDAGYPGEPLMAALEARGTHYVARVRNNAVLKRLALPAIDALAWDALLAGRPYEGDEPRTWVCESPEPYRAGSWSRARPVVQVLVEEPGELFPRSFWRLTSLPAGQVTGEELLAMYRQRGKAEGHMGELMSVVNPALSSSPRPKRHYCGRPVEKPGPGVDAFAFGRGAPASRRLRLPDHARPARSPRTRDRHRVEPEAASGEGAARAGPLHRLRPPDHHDRERGLPALALRLLPGPSG